jgi:adenylate kinase
MVALEVDDEILIKRLLERGKVSGRADDSNSLIIKNRIKEYYSKTAILKTFYQRKNCYFGVDGVGEIEEITSRITNVINNL